MSGACGTRASYLIIDRHAQRLFDLGAARAYIQRAKPVWLSRT